MEKSKKSDGEKYFVVTVETTTDASEVVSDILTEFGADGVEISDPADIKSLERLGITWDYIEEESVREGPVIVKGFFVGAVIDRPHLMTSLAEYKLRAAEFGIDAGSLDMKIEEGKPVDWLAEFQKHFKLIKTEKFRVVYEGGTYPPPLTGFPPFAKGGINGAGLREIYIEPGTAFGTGQHETTFLCLDAFSKIDLHGKTVIDAGCGSGILGIAALAGGAKACTFYDIDPQALEAAKRNLQLNKAKNFEVKHALEPWGDAQADIILANITANVLIGYEGQFSKSLKKGGILIMSGIISEKVSEVKEAYKKFKLIEEKEMGEWVLLTYGNS